MLADREDLIASLRRRAASVRRRDLAMLNHAGLGHPGGDLSATDILATLYFAVLRVDPAKPRDPERDRFILSKGHCSGALYATLAEAGFFPQAELDTFMQPLSRLNGHPEPQQGARRRDQHRPARPRPAGRRRLRPRGQAGRRGLAHVRPHRRRRAAGRQQLGGRHGRRHIRLDNLTVIVDRNGLQQGDATERTIGLEPLADKLARLRLGGREVDGHDLRARCSRPSPHLPFEPGRPDLRHRPHAQGQGVSFIEDQVGWHHRVPTTPS